MRAFDRQVGGSHYKVPLQPFEFSLINPNISGVEFSVIRYLMRAHKKNGVQDLEKALHCVEFVQEASEKYKFLLKPRRMERVAEFLNQFEDLPVFVKGALVQFVICMEDGHTPIGFEAVCNLINLAIEEMKNKENKQ